MEMLEIMIYRYDIFVLFDSLNLDKMNVVELNTDLSDVQDICSWIWIARINDVKMWQPGAT